MSSIKDVIVEATTSRWEEHQKPLLLSHLPAIVSAKVSDFRDQISPLSIGQYIRTEIAELKLVRHPIQKAKVGAIPVDEEYEFPIDNPSPDTFKRAKSRRGLTIAFLKSLNTLDKDKIDKIMIPTSVIVELLKLEDED